MPVHSPEGLLVTNGVIRVTRVIRVIRVTFHRPVKFTAMDIHLDTLYRAIRVIRVIGIFPGIQFQLNTFVFKKQCIGKYLLNFVFK